MKSIAGKSIAKKFFVTKLVAFAGAVTTVMSQSAVAALPQGAPAPTFRLSASLAGKPFEFSLQESLARGPVVVYFYPSAYTGGCNIQAHDFSVNSEKFTKAGASIIGVSLDSIERLNQFSADPEYCAGKFPVASDVDGKVARAYELNVRDASPGKLDTRGVEIDHGFSDRATFVVTPDGKIAATIEGVSPKENVEKALLVVQGLAGGA